jgi:gas vesicle protein
MSDKKNLWPFLLGAAVGAGITWLFASKEGKETLSHLKKKADEMKDDVNEWLDKKDMAQNNNSEKQSN